MVPFRQDDPFMLGAGADPEENRHCHFLGLSLGTSMLLGAGISGGAGLLGSALGSSAEQDAAQQAAATQLHMFNTGVGINNAASGTGAQSLYALSQLEGIPFSGYNNPVTGYHIDSVGAGGTPASSDIYSRGTGLPATSAPSSYAGDTTASNGYPSQISSALSSFRGSPDYQFLLNNGLRSLSQSQAATGTLGSGSQAREAIQYGQGLASTDYQQFFNNLLQSHSTAQTDYQNLFSNAFNMNQANQSNYLNYFNRLSTLAGYGNTANANTGTLAGAAGTGMANSQLLGGQAAAAGYTGGANAIGGAVNNYQLYGLLGALNPSASASAYGTGTPGLTQAGGFDTSSTGFNPYSPT